jgi:hypothetical protein
MSRGAEDPVEQRGERLADLPVDLRDIVGVILPNLVGADDGVEDLGPRRRAEGFDVALPVEGQDCWRG